MKKVYLSLVILIGFAANIASASGIPSSDWAAIVNDAKLYPNFPQINFNGGVSKGVHSICLEADRGILQGGTASVCAKYGRNDCAEYKTIELAKSINQSELKCFRWGTQNDQDSSRNYSNCEDLRVVPVQIALTYNIDVFNKQPAGPGGPERIDFGFPLFTKPFSIPACSIGGGTGIGGDN